LRKVVFILALALALSFFDRVTAAPARPHVVVVMAEAAEAYEVALRGLREVLSREVDLDIQRIRPDDPAEGARIHALKPEVLVPMGSQATSWSLTQTRGIPIVFAMVLNPVSSGFIDSMNRPGKDITGASLDIPLAIQFRVLRELLHAQRVAVLFDPEHSGPVVESALQAARQEGIRLVPIAVPSPKALDPALQKVDRSFDALWSVADPTVLFSRRAVERMLVHSIRHQLPFMGLSEPYVRAGALLALSSSYETNGRDAGSLVLRVLAGESPEKIPISVPVDVEVVFNPRTATQLDLELASTPQLRLRAAD
jgi:putative ABC transport system substrate-binding protein